MGDLFRNRGFLGAFAWVIVLSIYIGYLHIQIHDAEVELRESNSEWMRAMGDCLDDKIHDLCELNGWKPPPKDWPWPEVK